MNFELEITPSGTKRKNSKISFIKSFLKILKIAFYLQAPNKKKKIYGNYLGIFSLFLDPILRTSLYVFIVVAISGQIDVSRICKIAVCVTCWRLHVEIIQSLSRIFINNKNLFTKFYISLPLVIMSEIFKKIYFFGFSLTTIIVLIYLFGYNPQFSWLIFIIIIFIQIIFSVSIGLICSVISLNFRDFSSILFFPLTVWWYISPALYDLKSIDISIRKYLELNPFKYFFETYFYIFFEKNFSFLIFFNQFKFILLIALSSIFLLFIGVKFINYNKKFFFTKLY